jgi:hypothetical protein
MRARLKDVPAGARFSTLLTSRQGRVRTQEEGEAVVRFDDRAADSRLSPEVVVETEEVVH